MEAPQIPPTLLALLLSPAGSGSVARAAGDAECRPLFQPEPRRLKVTSSVLCCAVLSFVVWDLSTPPLLLHFSPILPLLHSLHLFACNICSYNCLHKMCIQFSPNPFHAPCTYVLYFSRSPVLLQYCSSMKVLFRRWAMGLQHSSGVNLCSGNTSLWVLFAMALACGRHVKVSPPAYL